MAWDDFEHAGRSGWTGDKPMDELALALARISEAYLEQFDRKPTSDEICYSLETILGADPSAYVSDTAGLENAKITIERNAGSA